MSGSNREVRGSLALNMLRVSVLIMASAMVGVLAHVAWRLVSG